MNNAVIGVGSNINPEYNVIQAENEVKLIGILKQKSDFSYTKPLLTEDQDDFLNGVFYIETSFEKLELKKRLKNIEFNLGRIRNTNKNGPRTIDLDIVVFNNQIIDYDVFQRDYLKNQIVNLLPNLSSVLNCKNYMNNFDDIYQIIDAIKFVLPNNPISIFGAGHWFGDEECATSNIDIIVIVKNIDNKYEWLLNEELEILQLNTINGFPVHVRLVWLEELEGKSERKCFEANKKKLQKLFIKQFPFYKLLYGQQWPIFKDLMGIFSLEEDNQM